MNFFLKYMLNRLPLSNLQSKRPAWLLVLWKDPLILRMPDWAFINWERTILCQALAGLKRPRFYILVSCAWSFLEGEQAVKLVRAHERFFQSYPRGKVIFLANDREEKKALKREGFEAYECNNNVFVNPDVFRPLPDSVRRWDAVYNARIGPYKRHYLAREIKSLGLLGYFHPRYPDADYAGEIRKDFEYAHWFNKPVSRDFRMLSPHEVNRCLNQCRVGLCLSRLEGAMLASMEYLLAGLPVVSTPSLGGRDVFFEEPYALIVEDRPSAVAAGVREMIRRDLRPEFIREKVLEKLRPHRDRFFHVVRRIGEENGVSIAPEKEWHKWIEQPNARKMFTKLSDLVAELR